MWLQNENEFSVLFRFSDRCIINRDIQLFLVTIDTSKQNNQFYFYFVAKSYFWWFDPIYFLNSLWINLQDDEIFSNNIAKAIWFLWIENQGYFYIRNIFCGILNRNIHFCGNRSISFETFLWITFFSIQNFRWQFYKLFFFSWFWNHQSTENVFFCDICQYFEDIFWEEKTKIRQYSLAVLFDFLIFIRRENTEMIRHREIKNMKNKVTFSVSVWGTIYRDNQI